MTRRQYCGLYFALVNGIKVYHDIPYIRRSYPLLPKACWRNYRNQLGELWLIYEDGGL